MVERLKRGGQRKLQLNGVQGINGYCWAAKELMNMRMGEVVLVSPSATGLALARLVGMRAVGVWNSSEHMHQSPLGKADALASKVEHVPDAVDWIDNQHKYGPPRAGDNLFYE